MTHLLLAAVLAVSVQDQLDGAEIGDATQSQTFRTDGKYTFERTEKAGKTDAKGTWKVDDTHLTVALAQCKGPGCKALGSGFRAEIAVVSDRAMTVRSTPTDSPLSTGSYYCHYQGCEKRTGVVLLTHAARARTMRQLLDFLISKNTARDVTVVWWGPRTEAPQAKSSLTYCTRDEARAKKGAEQLAQDLAQLPWLGALEPKPRAGGPDCLHDVELVIGDEVSAPAESKQP